MIPLFEMWESKDEKIVKPCQTHFLIWQHCAFEVTVFQLEKIYGKNAEAKEFIQTLIAGQKGTPHPQAPTVLMSHVFHISHISFLP